MNKNEDFFVQVTMTPEQARVVVRALDMFSRIHIGQFRIIAEQFYNNLEDREAVDLVERLLLEARRKCLPNLGHDARRSYGINGCPTEEGKVAWDVLQVVRQVEAYGRHPEGGISVVFHDPMFSSNSTPRPTAKRVTLLDRLADV